MGSGEARKPLTAMAGYSEESVADSIPGGAAAGGGNTGDATYVDADEAGAGGRHGAKTVARERVAGRREIPTREFYGVGGGGEGRKAYC